MRSEQIQAGTLEHWTPAEVSEAFDRNEIVLIDVRTPQEYLSEHIEGSILAPISTVGPKRLPSPEGKPIVFFCASGARSARMAVGYLQSGAPKAAHMEGGFAAWKRAGLPYVGTEPSTGAPRRMSDTAS